MSIPIDVREVLDEFLRRITAFDRSDTIEDHDLKTVGGPDYTFAGVLIPTSEDDLQLLDEGEIKSGSITVFTRGKQLFFKDIQAAEATAKQTFIRNRDNIYRVKTEADRTDDGMYRKYIAVRFVERLQPAGEDL